MYELSMPKRTRWELQQLQAMPLPLKIKLTRRRISSWIAEYGDDGVYVAWSGGKDSTVLRDIVRKLEADFQKMDASTEVEPIPAVFVNTGLEYPEVQRFVREAKDRGEPVEIIRPEMRFDEVIKKYGYPVISKEVSDCIYEARRSIELGNYSTVRVKRILGQYTTQNGRDRSMFNNEKYKPLLDVDFIISGHCCKVMKKKPDRSYQKKTGRHPMTAQMASESRLRMQKWIQNGCNGFDMKMPISNPMAFWTEQDVLQYIKENNLEIPSVYGSIEYADDPNQVRLGDIDPSFCDAGDVLKCTGCQRTGCIFCGFGVHLEKGETRFQRLKRTHPKQYEYCLGGGEYNEKGIWQPNKNGLGMKHVFDTLNRIFGDGFIRY